MPLVRISLHKGKPESYRRAVSDAVHRAMVETINVPAPDRFQIITEHAPGELVYDPSYLNVKRDDGILFIQITLNLGRTVEMKKALYRRMAELLKENPGVDPGNVTISLVEVPKENWSFGNGIGQYA